MMIINIFCKYKFKKERGRKKGKERGKKTQKPHAAFYA